MYIGPKVQQPQNGTKNRERGKARHRIVTASRQFILCCHYTTLSVNDHASAHSSLLLCLPGGTAESLLHVTGVESNERVVDMLQIRGLDVSPCLLWHEGLSPPPKTAIYACYISKTTSGQKRSELWESGGEDSAEWSRTASGGNFCRGLAGGDFRPVRGEVLISSAASSAVTDYSIALSLPCFISLADLTLPPVIRLLSPIPCIVFR